ncbi:dihydroorotase [Glycomyces buryatensis]|uniref:dihydroorotase n=1 Tax=Glycomyces buryatensis TaxID=2570927 RepID=UPI0014562D71|nr:dihydroorotase [Glycomyces buryatensis]
MDFSESPAVDLVIENGTLVDAVGEHPNTSVAVDGGRFVAVGPPGAMPVAERRIDASGMYLLPGMVDAHVHFREPGMEYKEGFPVGSGAAALGGVTTVLDMPNTEPPTDTAVRFAEKLDLVRGRSWVDYGFYALLGPGEATELEGLADSGAVGFKVFLGQSEQGPGCPLPPDDGDLHAAMGELARLGLRLAVHAENHAMVLHGIAKVKAGRGTGLEAHRSSRPPLVESEAIRRVGLFAADTGCAVHIVHVSAAEGVAAAVTVRSSGVDLTAETCPHYLLLPDEAIGERLRHRVNPPIRTLGDRDALRKALATGDLQFVASDHAPHSPAEKSANDVWRVRPGVIGVQHQLQILWSRRDEFGLSRSDLVRATAFEPARTWGLWPRKGSVTPGADADLVVIDPNRPWTIDEDVTHSANPEGPFAGLRGTGAPVLTLLRGSVVAKGGRLVGSPSGNWLPGSRWRGPRP